MLEVFARESGRFHAKPGPAWSQGFATYGGYVAAAACRAAHMAGHDRPLLSAQINFLAPASIDGFDIDIEALRVGKGTAVVEARVFSGQPETLAAKILFTFALPRPASIAVSQQVDGQTLETWRRKTARTADTPMLKGIVPQFLGQFHFRPLINGVPFSGTRAQDHLIAFKPKFDLAGTVAEQLLLLCDINPPALLMMADQPCPASTATWLVTVEFPTHETLPQDWFYVAIHLDTAAGGYGQHSTLIFDGEGRHIASNRQATTVFERDGGSKTLQNLPRRLAFKAGYGLFRACMNWRNLF